MDEKKRLRTAIMEEGRRLGEAIHQSDDRLSCEKLIKSAQYQGARCLFAFFPLLGEVSILSVLEDARAHKRLALPTTLDNGELHFRLVDDLTALTIGPFGIREPMTGPIVTPSEADLMLIPALAYTKDGQRLGRGKGYYDRYLALHPNVPTMGICRSHQLVDRIPNQGWDRPVDRVLCAGILY